MTSKVSIEKIARDEYAQKVKQRDEIASYYDQKRAEFRLDTTERIVRYLDDPGPYFHRDILSAHRDFDKIFSAIAANK